MEEKQMSLQSSRQGSMLVPALLKIFINDLEDWAECTLSKLTRDRKLGGVEEIVYFVSGVAIAIQ